MNKLVLVALAAGAAALPGTALAQAAHTMVSQGGHVISHSGGSTVHHRGGFRHHRFQRGAFIPAFWFGPQFHVRNWDLYGFAQPGPGHRWVRYYDDAYLIDGHGRVRDSRHGLDWDEYGEAWATEDGIPAYHGRGDWHPDEQDYAWVERHRPAQMAGASYGPGPACEPSPHPCGDGAYAYPGSYGYYGYGVAYPPIIIETTTVTTGGGCCASACCHEEVVTEVVETRPAPRRHRPQPRPQPRPRPPAGERG